MSKNKQNKSSKMKHSLAHVVRKVFDKNPESVLSHKEVCALIDVRENALRKLVYDILEDLVKQNLVQRASHGVYTKGVSRSSIEGNIELTARGAGFVITDDEQADIYIAPQNVGQALNGDRVRVHVFKRGQSRNLLEPLKCMKNLLF
jgi:ribonuclease R